MRLQIFTYLLLAVVAIALVYSARKLHEMIETARVTNEERMLLLKRLEATVDRMEKHTGVVANDLAASIGRADRADDTIPGSSADAALRTGEK